MDRRPLAGEMEGWHSGMDVALEDNVGNRTSPANGPDVNEEEDELDASEGGDLNKSSRSGTEADGFCIDCDRRWRLASGAAVLKASCLSLFARLRALLICAERRRFSLYASRFLSHQRFQRTEFWCFFFTRSSPEPSPVNIISISSSSFITSSSAEEVIVFFLCCLFRPQEEKSSLLLMRRS
jgi:hypothetical protein